MTLSKDKNSIMSHTVDYHDPGAENTRGRCPWGARGRWPFSTEGQGGAGVLPLPSAFSWVILPSDNRQQPQIATQITALGPRGVSELWKWGDPSAQGWPLGMKWTKASSQHREGQRLTLSLQKLLCPRNYCILVCFKKKKRAKSRELNDNNDKMITNLCGLSLKGSPNSRCVVLIQYCFCLTTQLTATLQVFAQPTAGESFHIRIWDDF